MALSGRGREPGNRRRRRKNFSGEIAGMADGEGHHHQLSAYTFGGSCDADWGMEAAATKKNSDWRRPASGEANRELDDRGGEPLRADRMHSGGNCWNS